RDYKVTGVQTCALPIYKGLGVSIVKREPARLYLHHYAVSGQKDMVCCRQGKAVQQRFIGGNRLGIFQALAVTAPKNISRDHELRSEERRVGKEWKCRWG